jgi:hypothetical protein
MGRKKIKEVPAEVKQVRGQLEGWRAQRRRGERIPQPLWEAAARAGGQYGVYQVSQALGLDYVHLKRRVEDRIGCQPVQGVSATGFVEVVGQPAEAGATCVVELEKGNGAKLRVCVRDAATVDWCRLKEAFLGA